MTKVRLAIGNRTVLQGAAAGIIGSVLIFALYMIASLPAAYLWGLL